MAPVFSGSVGSRKRFDGLQKYFSRFLKKGLLFAESYVIIHKLTSRSQPPYPGVAQLVAHLTGGQGVVSSSLATRTKKVPIFSQFGWKAVLFYFSNSKKRNTETSAQHPVFLACSTYFAEELKKAGISEGLVYISADLKDPKDIIVDFRQAFAWV